MSLYAFKYCWMTFTQSIVESTEKPINSTASVLLKAKIRWDFNDIWDTTEGGQKCVFIVFYMYFHVIFFSLLEQNFSKKYRRYFPESYTYMLAKICAILKQYWFLLVMCYNILNSVSYFLVIIHVIIIIIKNIDGNTSI